MDKNMRLIYMLPMRPISYLKTHRLKVKDEKRYLMQMETKRAEVALLISDKIDLKTKPIIRDKEGYY